MNTYGYYNTPSYSDYGQVGAAAGTAAGGSAGPIIPGAPSVSVSEPVPSTGKETKQRHRTNSSAAAAAPPAATPAVGSLPPGVITTITPSANPALPTATSLFPGAVPATLTPVDGSSANPATLAAAAALGNVSDMFLGN